MSSYLAYYGQRIAEKLAPAAVSFIPPLKDAASFACSFYGHRYFSGPSLYLATGNLQLTEEIARRSFAELVDDEKGKVYGKVWELAKMQDPTISGSNWGEEHALDDIQRLGQALHRLGYLHHGNEGILEEVLCLSFEFGEGGIGSQYFSLGEKLGTDPETGWIGYVNGMGMPSIEDAGSDASHLSDEFFYGNNLHCVYNSTHQISTSEDMKGYFADVFRMKAIDGGCYTKTSYLIVQQWIDYLDAHPEKKFLQVASSEGTAHVHAAVRLVSDVRSDLLKRIRILNFCPAYFLDSAEYGRGLQAVNFVKLEDSVILPWATGCEQIYALNNAHIVVTPHTTEDHPHNQLSDDYRGAARPFINQFMQTGNLIA